MLAWSVAPMEEKRTEAFAPEAVGCIFPFGLEMKTEIPACDLEGLSWPASMDGRKRLYFRSALCLLALCVCPASQAQAPPAYKVDASWPKQLPNNWIMGQVGGMAVDRQDHIWVLQRPGSNTKDDLGAAQTPPVSECCVSAPPVLVFDAEGNLLKSWGGPGNGYDWPSSEHSIFVDQRRKRLDHRQWRQRPAGDQGHERREIYYGDWPSFRRAHE